MKHIVVAGHSCIDLIPALPDAPSLEPGALVDIGPLRMRAGGSVVNTGGALVELGVPVELVTTIGDDSLGDYLHDELAQLGPTRGIRRVPGTGTSYSLVLEHGGRSRTLWHHIGSAAAFTGAETDPAGADLVHLGYPTALPGLLSDGARPLLALLDRIADAGATSSVDLSTLPSTHDPLPWPGILRRSAPTIGILTPSADDLVSLGWLPADPAPQQVADAAHRLLAAGAGVVMVSDGARGAYLCTADAERLGRAGRALAPLAVVWADHAAWVPAVPVDEVVTTNGAGDTATAGLLYGILNGYAPAEAGRSAVALAARRIRGLGLADPTAVPSSAGTG